MTSADQDSRIMGMGPEEKKKNYLIPKTVKSQGLYLEFTRSSLHLPVLELSITGSMTSTDPTCEMTGIRTLANTFKNLSPLNQSDKAQYWMSTFQSQLSGRQ